MWEDGTFEIDGVKLKYHAKVYEEGTGYGINNGRISKLMVNHDKGDGVDGEWNLDDTIIFYDRGWNIRPKTKFEKKVLNYMLKKYK